MRLKRLILHDTAPTEGEGHLQMFKVTFGDIRREVVDLDRTEQKAEREYCRALHYGRVAAERALCVH